ncbi:MAG: hypothetical protein LHW64_03375 [Candidatus Cloacimonetes bacterium]|jgi:hypothetical protein|nr:hypothetical protein [Candidatus Cloacimonadota bacterium]MDY0229149.1 hypothetical protein [Candidatus Cloacimonadaceae bacterium]
MIFELAAAHCLRHLDGSNPKNLIELNDNTIRAYHQLVDIYNDLNEQLKAERETPELEVNTP